MPLWKISMAPNVFPKNKDLCPSSIREIWTVAYAHVTSALDEKLGGAVTPEHSTRGFLKLGVLFLGDSRIRSTVFLGLYWVSHMSKHLNGSLLQQYCRRK